jgi:hypothetical protein
VCAAKAQQNTREKQSKQENALCCAAGREARTAAQQRGAQRTKRSKKKKKTMDGLVDEKEEQHHYGWMDITEIPNRYQPPSLFFLLAKFRQKEKLQFGNLEKRKKRKEVILEVFSRQK